MAKYIQQTHGREYKYEAQVKLNSGATVILNQYKLAIMALPFFFKKVITQERGSQQEIFS